MPYLVWDFASMAMGDGLWLTVSRLVLGPGKGSSNSDVSFSFCEFLFFTSPFAVIIHLEQSGVIVISVAKKTRMSDVDDVIPLFHFLCFLLLDFFLRWDIQGGCFRARSGFCTRNFLCKRNYPCTGSCFCTGNCFCPGNCLCKGSSFLFRIMARPVG